MSVTHFEGDVVAELPLSVTNHLNGNSPEAERSEGGGNHALEFWEHEELSGAQLAATAIGAVNAYR